MIFQMMPTALTLLLTLTLSCEESNKDILRGINDLSTFVFYEWFWRGILSLVFCVHVRKTAISGNVSDSIYRGKTPTLPCALLLVMVDYYQKEQPGINRRHFANGDYPVAAAKGYGGRIVGAQMSFSVGVAWQLVCIVCLSPRMVMQKLVKFQESKRASLIQWQKDRGVQSSPLPQN